MHDRVRKCIGRPILRALSLSPAHPLRIVSGAAFFASETGKQKKANGQRRRIADRGSVPLADVTAQRCSPKESVATRRVVGRGGVGDERNNRIGLALFLIVERLWIRVHPLPSGR